MMIRKGIMAMAICLLGISAFTQSRNYLVHTDAKIAGLKKQIENDASVKAEWEQQYASAEELLGSDRLRTNNIPMLGLAYRMTGEDRFAEAIKKIIFDSFERDNWTGAGLLSRNPPWRSGLPTAGTSFSIAVGFDCAYNYFTKEERMQIAKGLMRLGIDPLLGDWMWSESSMHTFDTMGHNWWSVCVFMAGASSLAIRNEIPEALDWAKEIAGYATEWFYFNGSVLQNKPPLFDKDGGFYESIGYSTLALRNYLSFREVYSNVLPDEKQPDLPIMDNLGDFYINTTYYVSDGRPMSTNFGDASIGGNGSGIVKQLWDLGYEKDRYAWYLNKTSRRSSGSEERGRGRQRNLLDDTDLPELKDSYLPDLPLSHLYSDMGWATLRNSWEDNATMLGVKCGFTWNHAHADAGSYILFHNGKNLIIDCGSASYGSPLYESYYLQSEAHNVVFFNGQAQNKTDPYFGVINHGSLHNLVDGGDFKYLLANATGPYTPILDRNYRHFIWVGDVILVIDDLLAREPGQFEWLLHYNGESRRNGLDISIKEDDAEVLVRPLYPETFPTGGGPVDFPEQMRLEEKLGYKDHEPQTRQPYWSVSHFEQTARTKFITAIILKTDKNEGNLPVIERFRGNDFLGVSITQNGKRTDVYLNLLADGRIKHRNSVIEMNGWKTDAFLTAIEFDEGKDRTQVANIKNLFIAHGSYLRRDNNVLIHSLGKYTGLVQDLNGSPEVIFQGQPNATLRIRSTKKVTSMKVNDKSEKGIYEASKSLLKIQLYE